MNGESPFMMSNKLFEMLILEGMQVRTIVRDNRKLKRGTFRIAF